MVFLLVLWFCILLMGKIKKSHWILLFSSCLDQMIFSLPWISFIITILYFAFSGSCLFFFFVFLFSCFFLLLLLLFFRINKLGNQATAYYTSLPVYWLSYLNSSFFSVVAKSSFYNQCNWYKHQIEVVGKVKYAIFLFISSEVKGSWCTNSSWNLIWSSKNYLCGLDIVGSFWFVLK